MASHYPARPLLRDGLQTTHSDRSTFAFGSPAHADGFFAVEFRHSSWLNSETLKLEKYQVAYTIVDEPLLPPNGHANGNCFIRDCDCPPTSHTSRK